MRTTLRTTLRRLDLEERIGVDSFPLRIREAVADFLHRSQAARPEGDVAPDAPLHHP